MTQAATQHVPSSTDDRAASALERLRRECPESWRVIVERVSAQRPANPDRVSIEEEPATTFVPSGPW
ncbi:MAG: hypothetical protein U0987_05100 [Afipia sp.]|nr:hypothetical protein [Afipia sp.]